MEAETGVMWPQVKDCWPPSLGCSKRQEQPSSGVPPEMQLHQHLDFSPVELTLDFQSPGLWDNVSAAWRHLADGTSGQQPQEAPHSPCPSPAHLEKPFPCRTGGWPRS